MADVARIGGFNVKDKQAREELEELKANIGINIKDFGVMGDGTTDDYEKFQEALYYCADNNKKLFIPNGIYLISNTLKFASSEDDIRANKLFNIEGESSNVIVNKYGNSEVTSLFDFEFANYLRIKNVSTENLAINLVPSEIYFEGFDSWSAYLKKKDFVFENLLYNGTGGSESYYHLICTPAPEDAERFADGKYARYPMRINSNSGYNAIEIENFNYNETDNTATATDNSAIGIIDRVTNSTGVIFVDMKGERPFERYVRGNAPIQSEIRPGTVYEVSANGHIAIGCSTDYNDSVAKSVSAIKIRDNAPQIDFFDASNQNRLCYIKAYKPGDEDTTSAALVLGVNGERAIKLVYKYLNNQAITGTDELRIILTDMQNDGLKFYAEKTNTERALSIDDNGNLRYGVSNTTAGERQKLQLVHASTTYYRPSLGSHWRDIGQCYFDTDKGKPIWWTGSKWVDANGNNI